MPSTPQQQSPAIPFIYLQDQKFIVSPQAKLFLSQLKNPICVLTIVGKYRTGKSLFLNRIMLNRPKAFKVSPTINSCTRGLWLWKDTLKFKNDEQEKEVLVIDSEGFGATEESDAYNNKILLFALLLSSYFVYNSVGSIDQNSLNNISVLANLANQIQTKNSKDQNIDQYFPSFLWLVRDFTLNLVDKNDFPIQAKDYLQQALEIQKGTSNLIEGKNKIRRMMKHFFRDRDCCTLVRPVETEDMLQQLDTLQEEQFRATFLEQARGLRQKILTKIKPKKLKNTLLTGESLCELAQNYVDVINSNSLPNFESSYKHLLKLQMTTLKKRICAENQHKAKQLTTDTLRSIKSMKQFQAIKQIFLSEVQALTRQNIKSHHSLSAFANSQEIVGLVGDIKSTVGSLVDKFLIQAKQDMKFQYISILDNLKQDNLMRQSLSNIHNEHEFKQFIGSLSSVMSQQISEMNIPQFIVEQFEQEYFQKYVQSLQQQFSELSTRRLYEENNALKIRLEMKEQNVKEKEGLLIKMQCQMRQQRKKNVALQMKLQSTQKQLTMLQQDIRKRDQLNTTIKTKLQQANHQFQSQSAQLNKELQLKNQQVTNLHNKLQQKSQQFIFTDKELTICKQRLQARIEEVREKTLMIGEVRDNLEQKNAKIQTLLQKIEQLRQSKQQLYEKLTTTSHQASARIVNLESSNSKLSTQLKEARKLFLLSETQHNQHIKTLKEQLLADKENMKEQSQLIIGLQSTINHYEQTLEDYNNKEEKYKQFKKCIKNSSSIQCLHCTRFFMSSIFLTHLSVCGSYSDAEGIQDGAQKQEQVRFKVTNVAVHENNGKPFTVYQVECQKGDKKWIIEKKFTQFCQFNENLQNSLPGVDISQAKTIFDPKYLSKKSLSVQEKQFLIERYFNDLGQHSSVSTNKYWLEFIYTQAQNQSIGNSTVGTKRSVLNQIQESSVNPGLNYQMRKSQIKEENVKMSSSKSSKRQSTQSPGEFFKIWEQKQLRTKPSSISIRKSMHD